MKRSHNIQGSALIRAVLLTINFVSLKTYDEDIEFVKVIWQYEVLINCRRAPRQA